MPYLQRKEYQAPPAWLSSPNNFSNNASKSMDIVKAKQPPVSGNMTPVPSASPSLSMIFGVKYVGEENAQHLLDTV